MQVENAVVPDPAVALQFFAGPDEGSFVMVNLLRFRPTAQYADGSDADLSGQEAYNRYGAVVRTLIDSLGGRVVYSGAVTGLLLGEVEDLWDAVALVEYPSLAAFQGMIRSPEMRAIEHHRTAGLAGQLNIRTRPRRDGPRRVGTDRGGKQGVSMNGAGNIARLLDEVLPAATVVEPMAAEAAARLMDR